MHISDSTKSICKVLVSGMLIFFGYSALLVTAGQHWVLVFSSMPLIGLFAAFGVKTTARFRGLIVLCSTFFQFCFSLYIGFSDLSESADIIMVYVDGLDYHLSLDGLAILFTILTNFVFLAVYLVSRAVVKFYFNQFLVVAAFIHFFLLQFFLAYSLLFFYIFFEALLIPMFLLIGIWGSRTRKRYAAFLFFMYTLVGSIPMLLAICYLGVYVPSLDWESLRAFTATLSFLEESILFLCFFLGFAVKVPMFPFHLWLPEAHVEAPTVGSVILAGILLKLGGYGMLRFLIPLFPVAASYYAAPIFAVCVISVLYSALVGLCQLDLKKIIAYSSITHMNFSVAGLFSNDLLGVQGAVYSMVSHGLISSGLFLCVGVLYDRYKTRALGYYSGLAAGMPLFSILFFILIIANVGIPPLSGFVSELAILLGLAGENKVMVLLMFSSSVFMTINFFWVFNRICCGPMTRFAISLSDLTADEFTSLVFLVVGIVLFGLFPNYIFLLSLGFVENAVLY